MKGLLMSTAVSRLAVRVSGATAMSASCRNQQHTHGHTHKEGLLRFFLHNTGKTL